MQTVSDCLATNTSCEMSPYTNTCQPGAEQALAQLAGGNTLAAQACAAFAPLHSFAQHQNFGYFGLMNLHCLLILLLCAFQSTAWVDAPQVQSCSLYTTAATCVQKQVTYSGAATVLNATTIFPVSLHAGDVQNFTAAFTNAFAMRCAPHRARHTAKPPACCHACTWVDLYIT